MTFSFKDALIDASDWGTNLIKIISESVKMIKSRNNMI